VNTPIGFKMSSIQDCQIFISVLYDTLLTKEFLCGRDCYNFHPGILPDYRGSGAYSWALINKERKTGITLHKIDYNIDSGPIIARRTTPIAEYDTAETLFDRCMDLLFKLFQDYFHKILTNNYATTDNSGGHLYLKKDLQEVKDISHIVRALTFKNKESAYWYDSNDKKHYINWE